MKRSIIIAALLMIAGPSLLTAFFLKQETSRRCAFDGSRIDPLYAVTAFYEKRPPVRFTCVFNARMWMERHQRNATMIWVTDEETGRSIAADRAFYVFSTVITTPHTRNRIHVFEKRSMAEMHALINAGTMVKNPFLLVKKRAVQTATYRSKTDHCPESPNGSMVQKFLGLWPDTGKVEGEKSNRLFFESPAQSAAGFSRIPEKPPKFNA